MSTAGPGRRAHYRRTLALRGTSSTEVLTVPNAAQAPMAMTTVATAAARKAFIPWSSYAIERPYHGDSATRCPGPPGHRGGLP